MEWVTLSISVVVLTWTVVSFFLLKYQNKELQQMQAVLQRKIQSFNKVFELEIDEYKRISTLLFPLIKSEDVLYGPDYDYTDSRDVELSKKHFRTITERMWEFKNAVYSSAPFINEIILSEIETFILKCETLNSIFCEEVIYFEYFERSSDEFLKMSRFDLKDDIVEFKKTYFKLVQDRIKDISNID